MTTAARVVLADCREALAEFTNDVQGSKWRRRWTACVVLLRAVGHVLRNADGVAGSPHCSAISEWWDALKDGKPAIFEHFIEQERNSLLKEYETFGGQSVTIELIGAAVTANAPSLPQHPPHNLSSAQPQTQDRVRVQNNYEMMGGHFKGRDQRELIAEAITWWTTQLDGIDAAACAA